MNSDYRWIAKRSFLLLTALALINSWPMLSGRVPFPAAMVTQFPPWETVRGPNLHIPPRNELGDLVTELYPWKAFTHRAIASGTLPLWNAYLLLGAPFVGDLQTALFYPPHLLYALLPTPLAWSLSFLLRAVLAGLLASLLARALGANRTASIGAGVVFGFCGWVTAFQARPHLDTSLWLPLIFLSIDRLQRRPGGAAVALVAAAFALPVLAGQPENAAHTTIAGLAFFAYRLAMPGGAPGAPGRARFAALFGAAGFLAMGLAAVQMLPALEWIGQLQRGFHMHFGPKPLHELATFLSRDLRASPNSAGVQIPESAGYAGMLALLVAPLALLHRNRRDAIFFVVLVACALQIVYGHGPIYWLAERTPVLKAIPNGRLLVVIDLGLAVLAAMGLTALADRLEAGDRRTREIAWLLSGAALVPAALGIALVIARGQAPTTAGARLPVSILQGPPSSAVVLFAAALLVGLGLSGRLRGGRFAAAALAFTAVDLVTASRGAFPFARPGEIFPPAPTFDFLARDRSPHRVASTDLTWGSNFEIMYGLRSATGYTVPLRRARRLLSTLGPEGDATSFQAGQIVASNNRVLDLMSVKYLAANTWNGSAETLASRPGRFRLAFSDGSVRIFENLRVLPRAFLVPAAGIRVLPDEDSQLARLRASDFDPATEVILPDRPVPPRDAPGSEALRGGEVTGFEERINDARLRIRADGPGILVLSQMHYPGWKALIDGRESPVLRVDYAFLGVAVEAGTHDVRWVFAPGTLRIGALLSGAALIACLALCRKRG